MVPLKIVPRLSVLLHRCPRVRIRLPSNYQVCLCSQVPLSRLASALQLQRYSDEEIGAAFDEADRNRNGLLEAHEMDNFADMDYAEVCSLVGADEQKKYGVPREFFVRTVANLAERLDYRIYPIAVNLVLTGFAEGTLGPAMPLLI